MSIEVEKQTLVDDLAAMKAKLAEMTAEAEKKMKRLEKLEKVQKIFPEQPAPGTVLRFSRSLAGSAQKYTFVAFRFGPYSQSWVLTGRQNALRLLGLTERGNTWDDVLVAIGDAKVKVATGWSDPGEQADGYEYFLGTQAGTLFRTKTDSQLVEKHVGSVWKTCFGTTRDHLHRLPRNYSRLTKSQAEDILNKTILF